jgi:hypothetical protein
MWYLVEVVLLLRTSLPLASFLRDHTYLILSVSSSLFLNYRAFALFSLLF